MQDDADWGAIDLIKKGRVDKDNVFMFGWSNGGYYASIAATNKNNIYNCVVAGAPVTDLDQQKGYYLNRLRGAQEIQQRGYFDGSISPIDVVEDVSIPILIVHGDNDQRVPVKHAYKYADELNKYGKDHKLVILENADHFSNTLTYDHYMTLYSESLSFLDSCKK
jgi:dipeptidyl aminopeptidase/acylaminoacyl peptidase